MALLALILVIIAGLLCVIDLALGYRGTGRRWTLTPIAVILLCIAFVVVNSSAFHF